MRIRDTNKIDAICNKAVEIVVKQGFDGLSMQKLAKAANVSPATIYIYFKDKEDLILKISVKEVEKMIATTFKNFDPAMPFGEGLKIQWKNRAKYWLKNPIQARFMEQVRHSPIGETVFKMVKKEFSAVMREFVEGAIKRKELIKLPLEVYWSIAFAPLYTLIKFHNDGRGVSGEKFVWSDEYMKQSLKLVLKALKP
jgi:AcrR family transcriptional regulator